MPIINDPTAVVVHAISGTISTIGTLVEAYIVANMSAGTELWPIQYVSNANYPNRMTAILTYEPTP